MTGRIFLKLILAVGGILIVALTAIDYLVANVVERTYVATLRSELTEKGRLLSQVPVEDLRREFVHFARSGNIRLTWVSSDGRVLADSENNPGHMENHRSRPEFIAALSGHEGSAIRLSPTMGVSFLYVAVPVDGAAIRLAVPLSNIARQVNSLRRKMLVSAALAFFPSILLAAFLARYFSRKLAAIIEYAGKLAHGDFKARLDMKGNDELGVLGRKLNETGEKLQGMFEQLEREHSELEKLERIRKDFIINVSHELRTPLASIQGYTETLLEGAIHDADNNLRFLGIIRQNVERLRRLTEDLLSLSRIELKLHRFQFEHYDVARLLAEEVDAMRPIAAKKQISLSLEPPPPGTQAFCDSEALHQIVINLLDNALKYTPDRGSVVIGARAASDDRVMVYVRDTGMGIPPEDVPRLFERFYRVDKARSREMGGTGLGLSIVKHLVKAHGGEVGVESRPEHGSTFFFTLPTADAEQPETLDPSSMAAEPSLHVTQ